MRRLFVRLAPLALFAGALALLAPAWAISWVACENEGTPACDRQELANLQFWIALAGLVPVALLVWDGWRGRRRAGLWLALAAATYVTWALAADAAVHG